MNRIQSPRNTNRILDLKRSQSSLNHRQFWTFRIRDVLVENLIQSCVERMGGAPRQVLRRDPTSTPASPIAAVCPSPLA